MKGPLDRTKVVLRHLPPTISQSNLVEHIDSRFAGRYRWLLFRPGKSGTKRQKYSRAYIDFNKPDDVIDFAVFFNGHAFVNEKGAQFKAIVEYAPSQRVPKEWPKKDGREGTIEKDPEYLEFLESIAKPVENLPSAEIQLERRESERAGLQKDIPVVTPLMEFVRQKRAAKRNSMNGKLGKRLSGLPPKNVASGSSKKGSERRNSGTMYVLRDRSKGASSNDKASYILGSKEDSQWLVNRSNKFAVSENDSLEGESGGSAPRLGNKKVLLLKGKETEIFQSAATPLKMHGSAPSKQNQRREPADKMTRSILKRETNLDQPASGSKPELDLQPSIHDTDQRTPQPSQKPAQKVSDGVPPEKHDRRTRNKDRPDRVVWAPHRLDGSHASHESLSSSSRKSQAADTDEGSRGTKHEVLISRSSEGRPIRSHRGGQYSGDNGSYRHGGRRSVAYSAKDADVSLVSDGKSSKRGVGSHEKQVWVQKSGSSL